MEFLVQFTVTVPAGTARSEVVAREEYRADSREQLDGLLGALPLADWMDIEVTPLEAHPNDPGANG